MKYPKISIISPSFNQSDFIEDAILSVLAQEYPCFEHIIIDGGSTDGTLNILKKYKHLKWISEPDEGQSDALNKGFLMSTGEIIGWLNTDDYYLPGTFHKVREAMTEREYDGVYGNYRIVDVNSGSIRAIYTQKASRWMSLFYHHVPSETLFFRRDLIERGLLIDKKFDITMDKEFVAHMLYSGCTLKRVNSFFAHFRKHDRNKSNNSQKASTREGIIIFNRYSGFTLPVNPIGYFTYRFLVWVTTFNRVVSRTLKTGAYSCK